MQITQKQIDAITYKIIGCAIEVHKEIGVGLSESLYEACLLRELELQGLRAISQQQVMVTYKGIKVKEDLRFDILVEDLVVIELKTVQMIHPVFEAQLLTYMKLLQKPKGILLNFYCTNIFKEGQITLVNEYYKALPKE